CSISLACRCCSSVHRPWRSMNPGVFVTCADPCGSREPDCSRGRMTKDRGRHPCITSALLLLLGMIAVAVPRWALSHMPLPRTVLHPPLEGEGRRSLGSGGVG